MDTQTILTVVGVATTVILGFWAIIIAVRHNKNVQITFAEDLVIALTDDITQNFPDLEVQFRGHPVTDNLVLFKGYLINTGKKDISHEMVEKPITLTLPKKFEWVECKVVECSSLLRASTTINEQIEIAVNTGLWKIGEYLKIEALAKVPVVHADPENPPEKYPTHRLIKSLSFPHRIADSKSVIQTRIPKTFQENRGFRGPFSLLSQRQVMLTLSIASILTGIALYFASDYMANKNIGYCLIVDGEKHFLEIGMEGDKIVLSDKTGYEKMYSTKEFIELNGEYILITYGNEILPIKIVSIIYAIAGSLLFIQNFVRNRREKRLLAMIAPKGKV